MARELEGASLPIDFEHSNMVGSLIAGIKELASRVEAEAAWVIPSCPFFSKELQLAGCTDQEDPDAVVQSVPRINKLSIT